MERATKLRLTVAGALLAGNHGIRCWTGFGHAGARSRPRQRASRSNRAGPLGLRSLGLPLASKLLGPASLLGRLRDLSAASLLGRRLGLAPPRLVVRA